MKDLSLIVFLISLLACQSRTTSDQATDSLAYNTVTISETNSSTPEASDVYEENVSSSSFNTIGREILVLPGVEVYPDSTTLETMGERAVLEKVRVMAVTNLRYPPGDDLCNQFFRYEVLFAGDEDRGWVSGKDVLMIHMDDNAYVGELEFRGKNYQVFYGYDDGIGPSDTNGLTGCNAYAVPYLQDTHDNTIRFIEFTETGNSSGLIEVFQGWLSLVSSEGGSAAISTVDSDDTEIRFNVDIGYQEGGETVIIHITENEGTLTVSSLQTVAEESGD